MVGLEAVAHPQRDVGPPQALGRAPKLGYDVGKVVHGSFGTLAIVTDALFRLHPLPAAQQFVSVTIEGPEDAQRLAQAVLHAQVVPGALEVDLPPEGPGTLTVLLERRGVAGIIGFGVGGAFLSAGLAPGDVAIATEEIYGDEGVATSAGWLSCEGIGIPLHSDSRADHFNRFPVDAPRLPEVIDAVRSNGATVAAGPFVRGRGRSA